MLRWPGKCAVKPRGCLHLDLCESLVPTVGNKYPEMFAVVDRSSRWTMVYGLRRKSEALAPTQLLLVSASNYVGRVESFSISTGGRVDCSRFAVFRRQRQPLRCTTR